MRFLYMILSGSIICHTYRAYHSSTDNTQLSRLDSARFPSTWPLYPSGQKLGNWLENYADALDLNYWTSTTVAKASQDSNNMWHVTVQKGVDDIRTFVVKHLVFATGYWGGDPYIPQYPGMDEFQGKILHSFQHGKATDHIGKKVVVIGSCSSGQDICKDYSNHGVDVTMYQRSSTHVVSKKSQRLLVGGLYAEDGVPPIEIADHIDASYTNLFMEGYGYRTRIIVEETDKELLEGLRKRGFRTNKGYKDASGLYLLAWTKGGGYYIENGSSQLIIDGKIKLKNDSQIKSFTENGLLFENGSELLADVVVFCTGFSDSRDGVRKICGDEVSDKCSPIGGLNAEGEVRGAWREIASGYPNLWYMMGTLSLSRHYSKFLALQIKAKEEGMFGVRHLPSA
ncbi:hypothetical protein AX14_014110 [Amanita brunnescens Koide BX004]|nr:hypothetical protein AX14_014110 [Amanita brunnescens Koide BX004]